MIALLYVRTLRSIYHFPLDVEEWPSCVKDNGTPLRSCLARQAYTSCAGIEADGENTGR